MTSLAVYSTLPLAPTESLGGTARALLGDVSALCVCLSSGSSQGEPRCTTNRVSCAMIPHPTTLLLREILPCEY